MTRSVLLGAALFAAAGAPACRTVPGAGPTSGDDASCVVGRFNGRFDPDEAGEAKRRLRLSVRVCRDDTVLLEVQGVIGGTVLTAAVRDDRLLLLLPKERRAVLGPADSSELWESETGLPFDGQLLRELFREQNGGTPRESRIGSWNVVIEHMPGERFPTALAAVHESGMRLDLEIRATRPATGPTSWPTVPDDFERIEYDR